MKRASSKRRFTSAIWSAFGPATLFLQLIVHLLLGFRELREARAYRDDPLVQRLLDQAGYPDPDGDGHVRKHLPPQNLDRLA